MADNDFGRLIKGGAKPTDDENLDEDLDDNNEWDQHCWRNKEICLRDVCMAWIERQTGDVDDDGDMLVEGACSFVKANETRAQFSEQATGAIAFVFGLLGNIPMGVVRAIQAKVLEKMMGVATGPEPEGAGAASAAVAAEGAEA